MDETGQNVPQEPNQDAMNEELRAAISKDLGSFLKGKTEESSAQAPAAANAETAASPAMRNPAPAAPAESGPSFSMPQEPAISRPIVRTYKSDVEETIQSGHISSVNIALAQNERARKNLGAPDVGGAAKSGIGKKAVILSLILVAAGALALLIPYFIVQKQANPPAPVETVPSGAIIPVDAEEKINLADINTSRFATTIKERVDQSSISLGQIKNIYFTEGTGAAEAVIPSSRFLSILGAHVPSDLARTLKDPFMFGMYDYNGIQRFLILKVGDYQTAFAGMLAWEPELWQDFKEAFELPEDQVSQNAAASASASSSASSTASSSPNPVANAPFPGIEVKQFEDASYDNEDARVVKDSSGDIVFLYSLIDDNTVVIATSVDTLKEIIDRATKSNVVTQ